MTKAKEELVEALLKDYDVVDGFIKFGLAQRLDDIISDIEALVKLGYLPDHKREDLMQHCKDAKAFVEVLEYYTGLKFDKERETIREGFYKWTEFS